MASRREAQRAKEKDRKAALKGTSLARSQRPPPRTRPPRTFGSDSQTGLSYQSHQSTAQLEAPSFQNDTSSMDLDHLEPGYNPGPIPPSLSPGGSPGLLLLPLQPTSQLHSSPKAGVSLLHRHPRKDVGSSESSIEWDQLGQTEAIPQLIEQSDNKNDGDGPDYHEERVDAGENDSEGSSEDERPWFLAVDDHDWQAPSPSLLDDEDDGGGTDYQEEWMDTVENDLEGSNEDERPWFLAVDDHDWQAPSPTDPGSDQDQEFGDKTGSSTLPLLPQHPDESLHSPIPSPMHSPSSNGTCQPIQICSSQYSHPSDTYIWSHPIWFVRIILLITVYLHFSYHLPYTACNVLLFCLSLILQRLNLALDSNRMPISLVTAIKSLHLKDQFAVYPTCPTCHRIETAFIPTVSQPSFTCTACDTELFSRSSSYNYLDALLEPITTKSKKPRAQPKLVVSYHSIPSLLSEFLSRDGMLEKMDAWRTKERVEGRLGDVMDGRIWKELEGPDKKPFFGTHCPEELRIGLVVQLDWCNFRRSAQSTHHSTGLFSISVANLPESERYQTKNLLVPCIIPGPKEPNTRQLQEYIILMVDEFLQLYQHGMNCPASPNRLVRVAVTLVICDHPAMCKFFGLADKKHENAPCHRCDVKASEWGTEKSLSGGCQAKTFEELRELALTYQQLSPDKQERAFKRSGVRWFAFLKLPYFNPLRMAVLDPMHNILLGVVKTQWYDIWIKQEQALRETTKDGTKRELEDVHSLLRTAEFPDWLGRIPSQIGIPAGGSLSADEWKALALVFGPLALPVVWDDWIDVAEDEVQNVPNKTLDERHRLQRKYEKALHKWEDHDKVTRHIIREQEKGRLRDLPKYSDADLEPRPEPPDYPEIPVPTTPRLKRGEMELFLKLSAALTVLLARTVYLDDLQVAHQRLLEYLCGYAKMYDPDAVKPNFHWATHLYDQILDYGPVYGFWAFLQERLNFIVKNFRTNNHGQGELEVTMMRSYSALSSLRNILASTIQSSSVSKDIGENECFILREVINRLITDPVARGTLEVTAQSAGSSGSVSYAIGPQKPAERLDSPFVTPLLHHINSQLPFRDCPVLRPSNPMAVPGRILTNIIAPITYMVLDGRRITAADAMRGAKRAGIVQARWGAAQREQVWVGELLKVFISLQDGLAREPLAAIRWLKPADTCPLRKNIWREFSDVLDIRIWEYQVFVDTATDDAPPTIIPFSAIISQAARITVRKAKGSSEKLWLTIGLDKHGTRL